MWYVSLQDEMLPPVMMRQLYTAVTAKGAESCTWVEFEDAGHMDAYEVAAQVMSCLARCGGLSFCAGSAAAFVSGPHMPADFFRLNAPRTHARKAKSA